MPLTGRAWSAILDNKPMCKNTRVTEQCTVHCDKKIFPSTAGMSLTKPPLLGIIKLYPARGSLVSDIPSADGKTANLFYSVRSVLAVQYLQCTVYRRLDARMTSQPPCVLCDVTWRPENPEIWGPSLTSLQNLPIKVIVTHTVVNIDR